MKNSELNARLDSIKKACNRVKMDDSLTTADRIMFLDAIMRDIDTIKENEE